MGKGREKIKKTLLLIWGISLLIFCNPLFVMATPVYEIIDLGIGMANDINNVGHVLGSVGDGTNGFIWDSVNVRQLERI